MTTEPMSIPYNREAEESTIGAVLINPEAFLEISQIVKARDFYIDRHKWIWKAFENLQDRREPIDLITTTNELHRAGKDDKEFGGSAYLTGLLGQVQNSFNGVAYAQIVKEFSERRYGIKIANDIAQAAYKTDQAFQLSSFTEKMMATEKLDTRNTPTDILGKAYSILFDPSSPLTFGIGDMDNRLGGMFRKELSVLAGDQGTGKSALMIWMARANARHGKRVLGVSLEMQAESWFMRMACGDLGINWNQVRAGKVENDKRLLIWEKMQELEETYRETIVIYEAPMTLQSIQAAVMRERPDIVFVDYVELIAGMRDTKNIIENIDQMNSIARFLRQNIAKPFDCHVVLLWQLNRAAMKDKRKPTKHDLYMAGTKDPDSILLLYRPDLYDDDAQTAPQPNRPVDMDVIIGKARNDFTGSIPIKYDLRKQAFGGLARSETTQTPS